MKKDFAKSKIALALFKMVDTLFSMKVGKNRMFCKMGIVVSIVFVVSACVSTDPSLEGGAGTEIMEEQMPAVDLETPEKEIIEIEAAVIYPDYVGLWLIEWNIRLVDYTNSLGELQKRVSYTPASYSEIGNPKVEYLFQFKPDGTGWYIQRILNIFSFDRHNYDVLYYDGNNQEIGDHLDVKFPFQWKEEEAGFLNIRFNNPGFNLYKDGTFEYEIREELTRPRLDDTVDGYNLGEELFLDNIGSLRRIDDNDAFLFEERYGL